MVLRVSGLSFSVFPVRALRVAALLALAACASDSSSADGDPVDGAPSYEEDTSSADALVQHHTVEQLAPRTDALTVRTLDRALAPLAGFVAPSLPKGASVAVLRSARLDRVDARIVIDVETLITSAVAADALESSSHAAESLPSSWLDAHTAHESEPAAYSSLADGTDADGAKRMTLTIDMCQSSRAWEKRFYDELSSLGTELGAPLPVGIAMTGGWARAHTTELADLRRRNGETLAIEWVNHSNKHPLHCTDASMRTCHFLTDPSVSMRDEVLGLEQVLLSQGEVPGALFRFPGLVHDRRRLTELNDLGLFALDADAWLAKGEMPHAGAVILVHGNGNEVPGIQKATSWLRAHKSELLAGTIRLVAPRAVVAHP